MPFIQVQNSSRPEEEWLYNLLLCGGSLLLFFVTCARSHIQTGIVLACVASLRMVNNAAQKTSRGRGGGRVVIIGDSDLFILFGLQLALIEAERPFKNVFDLEDKPKRQCKSWNKKENLMGKYDTRPTCLSPASDTSTLSSFSMCSWRITSWMLPLKKDGAINNPFSFPVADGWSTSCRSCCS